MIDVLRWLVVVEVVGAAFLPLTAWLFRWLPDRGYIFARLLGLVLISYVTWLVGSLLPVANSSLVPVLVIVVAACGWWLWRTDAPADLWSIRKVVAIEEGLFLGGIILWSVLRASVFHPGIAHTEQYMDMSLLGSSLHSASMPPFDPWMSGHSINYYYFGYYMMAMLIHLSGVLPTVGYNLALSLLAALTIAGSFSVVYALTRRFPVSLLAPLFVVFLGNWHAALVQIPTGHNPATTYYWFWDSSRVIQTAADYTINEFPYFSFMLGDLHPHVMALPVTILVIAFATNILLGPALDVLKRPLDGALRLLPIAIVSGSLFTINSWDFPTYLLLPCVCIAAAAYLGLPDRGWWKSALLAIGGLVVASVALFTPFYVHYRSVAHGIGFVSTPTPLGQFLQVFGLFLLSGALLLAGYYVLLEPADDWEEEEPATTWEDTQETAPQKRAVLEAGSATLSTGTSLMLVGAALVAIVFGFRYDLWVLLLVVAFIAFTLVMLQRVLSTEEPNRADAMALILLLAGCCAIALTEVVYLRDVFDGGPSYRMNTVFKFYYQAWTLLGLVAAYAVYRVWDILKRLVSLPVAAAAVALITVGAAIGAVYTVAAPQSAAQGGSASGLDGISVLQSTHPDDYKAIDWLRRHARNSAVELEATGGEYDPDYARVSTFTGLQTVMGWAGHEGQWRGSDSEIQRRVDDVNTIYKTARIETARKLLQQYHVTYVFVGDSERKMADAHLDKFGRFMHVAYRSGDTIVYRS